MPSIDLVHGREVGKVRHKNSAFHDMGKGQALVLENGLHILKHALRLRLDVTNNEVTVLGINRYLASAKEQIAYAHGVAVGADDSRRFRGFDDLFYCHIFEAQFRTLKGEVKQSASSLTVLLIRPPHGRLLCSTAD